MDGSVKVQEKGMNENMRRLSCLRSIVVNKDWKTIVHLLLSQATEVE